MKVQRHIRKIYSIYTTDHAKTMPAYVEMTPEQKKAFNHSINKYQTKRYIHDEDYRQKKKDNAARFYRKHADNPIAKLKGHIQHFIYYTNLRHEAGKPVRPNVKFNEYNIIYDMETKRYTSLRLKEFLESRK